VTSIKLDTASIKLDATSIDLAAISICLFLHFCDLFAHTLGTTFPDLGFPDLDPYGFSTLRIWYLGIWTFTDLVIYAFGIYGFGFTDLGLTDLDLRICPGILHIQLSVNKGSFVTGHQNWQIIRE